MLSHVHRVILGIYRFAINHVWVSDSCLHEFFTHRASLVTSLAAWVFLHQAQREFTA